MNTPQIGTSSKPRHGHPSCIQQLSHKEAYQVKPTHEHPSCIQQLRKTNIQPWAQPLRS